MLLEIKNLWGGYGSRDVVKGITCQADAGEVLCVLGPNGCGKTTLFRLLLGMISQSKGEIYLDGKAAGGLPPRKRARLAAYIPQNHTPVFAYTVLELVVMGRASHFSAVGAPRKKDRELAMEALEKLGAAHLADKPYSSLSGGQRQLALIARAICQSAKILIMDEPAANLDYANRQLLMDVALELAGKDYCIVMSTHSPENPFSVGHKVLMMKEGRLAAFGVPEEVITPKSLEDIYGIPMDVVSVKDRCGTKRTICLPVKAAGPEGRDEAAVSFDRREKEAHHD
ncbi:MAG: ABC transporter ATP-binding protein [Lachnospiraceae bacterium]|nr:ABC transporter ATP-binding protein [Lachnospiraceae bacterium]